MALDAKTAMMGGARLLSAGSIAVSSSITLLIVLLNHYFLAVVPVRGGKWLPKSSTRRSDPTEIWKLASVAEDFKEGLIKVQQVLEIKLKTDEDLPPLKNPDFLVGGNDLTSMSYLHEPAVLNSLKVRFVDHEQVYT